MTNTYNLLKTIKDHTKFTSGELQSLYSQFLRRGGKDNLDLAEFTSAMSQLGVVDPSLVESSFRAFDKDGNGVVDFKEFASAMSIITKGSIADKYTLALKIWDTNNNGTLDKDEFKKFLSSTQGNKVDNTLFNNIWADLDVDNKGFLTFEQCRKGIAKHQITSAPLLFEDLSPGSLPPVEQELASLLGERLTLVKGEVAYHQGSLEKFIYLLLEGDIELSRNGITFETISKVGDIFGGESLIEQPTGRATCISERVHLLRINVDDLIPLIYHSHLGALNLVQRAAFQLMTRYQQMANSANVEFLKDKEWQDLYTKGMVKLALFYHTLGKNGKLEISATKQVGTAQDLSVAYSPGVAEPCLSIKSDPEKAYDYTSKSHLVGVISNGTAVLGLGNIGALASKPVMEGKAVLFKKFGGLDAFDIEVDESNPEKFIDIVCSLEPTFGGVNLEDVKAPECFFIEKEVQRRCSIPIMHDDQHGTAIVAGAGLLNALQIIGKDITKIRVVISGCGAAGFTCAKYFISLGVRPENLIALDIKGVVHKDRDDLVKDPSSYLHQVAIKTNLRTLSEVIDGADVFLGVSVGGLLKPEMLLRMNKNPLVFALANPSPEISYNLAKQTRSDVIVATGRSDYPNQINNVCAFPYIFRGAMDVRAKAITEDIKQAATYAISQIAKSDTDKFGVDYIIPKPFDPRLKIEVSSAVAAAAMQTGIARQHIDIGQYKELLKEEL